MNAIDENKPESIFEQFKVLIQKQVDYKCSCGNTLHKQANYTIRCDIDNHNYLSLGGKEIPEHRYKLYYRCDELDGSDKYIGNPYGIGYRTLQEAANELKEILER